MENSWNPADLAQMRKAYDRGALAEGELASAPLAQFERWLREAAEAGVAEPNAMVLATADAAGPAFAAPASPAPAAPDQRTPEPKEAR